MHGIKIQTEDQDYRYETESNETLLENGEITSDGKKRLIHHV